MYVSTAWKVNPLETPQSTTVGGEAESRVLPAEPQVCQRTKRTPTRAFLFLLRFVVG